MAQPILVTGAGGCIGAWVLWQLARDGVPAVAMDVADDRRRLRMVWDPTAVPTVDDIIWEVGDIADTTYVARVFTKHQPAAVIHLAALQVPFCAADPVAGARINVVGGVNVFESAKQSGCKKVVYASSVAATAMADGTAAAKWKQTLYGAYKLCNEQTARVYAANAGVSSIGIRPSVVYGVGRDQGMSAAPTIGAVAAVLERAYEIPFTGAVGFVHAGEAAAAFIRAAQCDYAGSGVFALNGCAADVQEAIACIKQHTPAARITAAGAPLPFPADASDAPLRDAVGDYWRPESFESGWAETMQAFAARVQDGRLIEKDFERMTGR